MTFNEIESIYINCMHWFLIILSIIRTHLETTSRYQNHLSTIPTNDSGI